MRIRKRKVPLPLSLLSPIPLTDPHLFSRLPVESDHNFYDHVTIPTCCSASDLRPLTTVSLATTGVEGVQISNDDSSNASITTSAPQDDDINNLHNNNNNNGPLLLSNNEGVIPLKKRRTMIAKRGSVANDEEEFEDEKKKKMMMKSNNNGENSKKNNGGKRGSTIMEGSRCSRVNGRGWRCCQQTLVGYSLCEHHLGKGRLRSMAGSSSSNKATTAAKLRSSSKKNANNNNNNDNDNNNNNDDSNNSNSNTVCSFNTTSAGFMLGSHDGQQMKEETYANNSKRVKLGVVKARSLSSLLGQTNGMNNDIVGDHANMHPQQEKMSN